MAFALSALFALAPHSAEAAANCVRWGAGWPANNIMVCPSAGQDLSLTASGAQNALSNAPGQQTVTQLNGTNYSLISYMTTLHTNIPLEGVFYVFNSASDFETWAALPANFAGHGITYPSLADLTGGTPGFTHVVGGAPQYTVIFKNFYVSAQTLIPNSVPNNTAGHELGHWMDHLFAAKTGQTSANGASKSTYFTQELAADWIKFKTFQACGSGGSFHYWADNSALPGFGTPGYICNGGAGSGTGLNSPKYSGLNNQQVIQKAWPYYYADQTELFPEEFGGAASLDAQADTNNSPAEVDPYLGYYNGASFECTRSFISNLVKNNSLPKASSPPPNWPSECPLF